jgi:hypothetical protein
MSVLYLHFSFQKEEQATVKSDKYYWLVFPLHFSTVLKVRNVV